MKTTISRPALPGVAAAQPAPAPPARHGRGGSAPTCRRTLRGIVIAGAVAATLLLGTIAAWATVPPGTQDQSDQGQALSQSKQERTLARHRALGALDIMASPPAVATQPAARIGPTASDPGVDVPAILLVGLVGGLLGGAAVVVGWTAITRRRRPRAARAGT
jgi:hypothetical protein